MWWTSTPPLVYLVTDELEGVLRHYLFAALPCIGLDSGDGALHVDDDGGLLAGDALDGAAGGERDAPPLPVDAEGFERQGSALAEREGGFEFLHAHVDGHRGVHAAGAVLFELEREIALSPIGICFWAA